MTIHLINQPNVILGTGRIIRYNKGFIEIYNKDEQLLGTFNSRLVIWIEPDYELISEF